MGKRTSDFVALAAILGGASLGIGLTSLFARAAPVAQVDDVSVEVHFVKGRVGDASVAPTIYLRRRALANRPDPLLLRGDVEDLRRKAREIDLRALYEALEEVEEVEALEDLDLGQYLTLDRFQRDEDEDRRRKRRRRRPRQEAEVPDVSSNR